MSQKYTITHGDVGSVVFTEEYVKGLEAELANWKTWGTMEIAIRNPNIASFVKHWEERATKAEALLKVRDEQYEEFCEIEQYLRDQLAKAKKLRHKALEVANAIHVGTGQMIAGTMMEDDFREALGLKDGELWNFTTNKAERS